MATTCAHAMIKRNDPDGQDVVFGKFNLFGFCVFTLFDIDTIHLYIFLSYILPHNVKSRRLNHDVLVESPSGYQVVCNRIYRDCPFVIQKLFFACYLI